MPKYIEKEALMQAYYKIRPELGTRVIEWTNILENFPNADVQPVRHGKWTRDYDGLYKCSECGNIVFDEQKFCYNCGADMRGVENG